MSNNGELNLVDLQKKPLEEKEQEIIRLKEQLHVLSFQKREYFIEPHTKDGTLKFALMGDTHLGSLYERMDALQSFFGVCKKEGVKDVFHTGDIYAGWKVYKGQEFELYAQGYGEQRKAFEEKFPKLPGAKIHFILGNHDASIQKLVGKILGRDLEQMRSDFHYMGEDYAEVILQTKKGRSFRIALVHPCGSGAYAVSYRVQKYIESLPGGNKPHLLAMGHFHKSEFLPDYRNVAGFQTGTFESQTSLMKRYGSAAHVGGWIVEVVPQENLAHRIRAEWFGYYEPQK